MGCAVGLTEWLWVHNEWMCVRTGSGIADLYQDGIALVLLTIAVLFFQKVLRVAHLTPDATAWNCLEICAGTKRLCAKLLPAQITQ